MSKINEDNWLSWCRLCAKTDSTKFVPVIGKDGQTSDAMLIAAIGKHFWVNISADDEMPQHLCMECHDLISELQRFSQHVNKVQTMFYTLKTVDLNDLDKQMQIRHNHGISAEISHNLHKNCTANQDNLETHKDAELEPDQREKENMKYYEIIEINENEHETENENETANQDMENPEKAKENTYNITRRKRKAITKAAEEAAKKIKKNNEETVKNDNSNSFEDSDLQTNSEGDEDKNTHESSNKEVMQYECDICAKKYKMFMCYKKHMLETHNKEPCIKDFKCDCGKVFTTKRQLQTHERSHIPLKEKLLIPCLFCHKKFTKVNIMRQHMKGQHYNEKPYICDECGKALKTMAALNEHKLVHTNDCPFECDVCHKKFKNKARLKIHSDVHAESYNCNICGLLLNTRRTLRMHMLVHSEEKQFKCDFCSQAFKRGKALKNHLILHIGLRPYKCTFCDRAFANNSNCRAHKKKVHPQQLAQEEAKGIKSKAVVPLLHELRNSITQKEIENASKNLDTFLVDIDDVADENLAEKTNSPNISIEQANESDDDAQNYSFSDEEFLITKAVVEEEEGTETIVYEVLDDLPLNVS